MAKILESDIENSRCVKRGFLGVLYYLIGYFKKRHNPLGVTLATPNGLCLFLCQVSGVARGWLWPPPGYATDLECFMKIKFQVNIKCSKKMHFFLFLNHLNNKKPFGLQFDFST